MGTTPFLDFQAIKKSYSIEEIIGFTGLTFKKDGASLRCECPVHKGGKRSLVVTPNEADEKGDPGVFFCHSEKVGGDRVALLAHVRDSKPYAIFKELAEKRTTAPASQPEERPDDRPKEGEGGRGFRPLPYLQAQHDAVKAMGFEPETAQALGVGYSPRGLHRGRIAIPLRLADGTLAGYLSIEVNTSVQLPPQWHL